MKYPGIITALLLPLAAQAAPQVTAPPAAQSQTIEGQAAIDPAVAKDLPANAQPVQVEAHAEEAPAAPEVEHIEAQAEIDPAFLEKLKAEGKELPPEGQHMRLEAQAIPLQPNWSEAKPADLKALQQFLTEAAAKKEPWLQESYSVAMKAAALLATGKPGAPAPGHQQLLDLTLTGVNNGKPETISATVTFIGSNDEKLPGVRFTLQMHAKADGTWSITQASRAARVADAVPADAPNQEKETQDASCEIDPSTPEGRELMNMIAGFGGSGDEVNYALKWRDGHKVFQVLPGDGTDQDKAMRGDDDKPVREWIVDTEEQRARIPAEHKKKFDILWILGKLAKKPGEKMTPAEEIEFEKAQKEFMKKMQ